MFTHTSREKNLLTRAQSQILIRHNTNDVTNIEKLPLSSTIENDLLKYSKTGSVKQVEHLFDRYYKAPGFNINCRDVSGNTPLILASKRGHGQIVELLMSFCVDVTLCNMCNETVLHVGSLPTQKHVITSVVATASHNKTLIGQVNYLKTALCNAAWLGNAQIVQKLLGEWSETSIGRNGILPTNTDDIEILNLCVMHVSKVEQAVNMARIDYKPSLVLKMLLMHDQKNVRTPFTTPVNYNSPHLLLHLVANCQSAKSGPNLTRVLLDFRRRFDPLSKDIHGFTPIHYAARSGNDKILKLLLDKCIAIRNDAATRTNHTELVTIDDLYIPKEFPDIPGVAGNTPLHVAALEGRVECVKLLLLYGASPSTLNSQNRSAAHCARNHKVKQLLSQHSQQTKIPPGPSKTGTFNPTSSSMSDGALTLDRSNTTIAQVALTSRASSRPPKLRPMSVINKATPLTPIPTKLLSKSTSSEAAKSVFTDRLTGWKSTDSVIPRHQSPIDEELTEPVKPVKLAPIKRDLSVPVKVKKKNLRVKPKKKQKTKSSKEYVYESDFESSSSTIAENENDELDLELDDVEDDDAVRDDVFGNEEGRNTHRVLSAILDESPVDLTDFRRGRCVGAGGNGRIYKVMLRNGGFCVLKEIVIGGNDDDEFDRERPDNQFYKIAKREIELLISLRHPNIVRCLGMEWDGDPGHTLCIFMELVSGGSLYSLLREFEKGFPERIVRNYMRQLIAAVAFLHDAHIIHRDIKGANIMVTVDGVVKLIDFGCAKKFMGDDYMNSFSLHCNHDNHLAPPESRDNRGNSHHQVGSIYWTAPELLRNEEGARQNPACDIWSIGCTMYEMFTKYPPWHGLSPYNIAVKLGSIGSQCSVPSLRDTDQPISSSALDFIDLCLSPEPHLRPSAADLALSAFLRITSD